jgi:transcription elongation factor
MDMKGLPKSVKPFSWIRINKAGTYKGDLGLVLDEDTNTRNLVVALVPRLNLNQNRKRKRSLRTPAALFDVQAVKAACGDEELFKRNQIWVYRDNEYKAGLLEKTFSPYDVSDIVYNAAIHEIELFRSSEHGEVLRALDKLASFRLGDRIQVIRGAFAGARGDLVDIQQDGTATFRADGGGDHHDVYISDIRKQFSLGDYVQVYRGKHQGEEGYLVGMTDDFATIYKRGIIAQNDAPHEAEAGKEVRLDPTRRKFCAHALPFTARNPNMPTPASYQG